MKKRVAIVHGWSSNPTLSWYPWLQTQIENIGHQAHVPKFPTPLEHTFENWKIVFDRQIGSLSKDMILVGHSAGTFFLLQLLNESNTGVGATFLVSGFAESSGLPNLDEKIRRNWVFEKNWARIRQNAGTALVYHGDDDPHVPLQNGRDLAAALEGELKIIPQGKHLSTSYGWLDFPLLWQDLQLLLSG